MELSFSDRQEEEEVKKRMPKHRDRVKKIQLETQRLTCLIYFTYLFSFHYFRINEKHAFVGHLWDLGSSWLTLQSCEVIWALHRCCQSAVLLVLHSTVLYTVQYVALLVL